MIVGYAKVARFGTGAGYHKPFRRKSPPEQLAYRRRPARHAPFEPEIVDENQLLGGKHDLQSLAAQPLHRHFNAPQALTVAAPRRVFTLTNI
jgi:hypothetical protein